MGEKMTLKEVLIMTRDLLRSIGSVPLDEVEHIGIPLNTASRNMDECIKAIQRDEARAAEEEARRIEEEAAAEEAQKEQEGEDGNADTV